MNSKIRIAIVITHLGPGGRERSALNLANSVHSLKFSPTIVCLESGDTRLEKLLNSNVGIVSLNKRPGNDPTIIIQLARYFKSEKFDVIHSNSWGTLLECIIAARLARITTVIHTQGGLDYGSGERISRFKKRVRLYARRVFVRGLTKIIPVSNEIKCNIIKNWKAPEEKVIQIPNGVNVFERKTVQMLSDQERFEMRKEFGIRETEFVIGSVGHLRPVKDYPTLLNAMTMVTEKYPQSRLIILGDGSERKRLEELVARLTLGNFVKFLGKRIDVERILTMMDLFVLNSVSEGISNAILEAMAAGLPVVATSVGGNPEIVVDQKSGLLVPPSSAELTQQAIMQIAKNKELRISMGKNGRGLAEGKFSLERMVNDYENLYESLVC